MTYFGISPKGSKADLPSGDGSDGVNDDGHKRFLEVLVQHLSGHVNAGQPATVARVTVVPAYGILMAANLHIIAQNVMSRKKYVFGWVFVFHCCHITLKN